MPSPASDDPSISHSSTTSYDLRRGAISHRLRDGFLPDHRVAIRITRAGEDISDYLTYVTADLCDGQATVASIPTYPTASPASYTSPQPTTAPILTARAAGCGVTPAASSWLRPNRRTTFAAL